jgi:hypothetical protein
VTGSDIMSPPEVTETWLVTRKSYSWVTESRTYRTARASRAIILVRPITSPAGDTLRGVGPEMAVDFRSVRTVLAPG